VNVLKFQRRGFFYPFARFVPFNSSFCHLLYMPERIYVAAVEGFIIICFPGLIRNFAAFGICIFMATLSGAWAAIISPSRVL